MNELDKKIAKGAAWMVGFKLIDRLLGLLSTVVLARLLIPAEFGLVAMAMLLVGALQLLVSFSFDVPLIQNPNAGRDHFDTAWTLNIVFAALCGVVLGLLASPVSKFYHEPRLELVVYFLALAFFIQGFSNIGAVVFRREMRFDREFKFLIGKRLAGLFVTIPLAFWLRNHWALVLGQLAGALLSVLLSYVVSEYRPRFSLKSRVDLFHTSKWLVLNNVLHFMNGRSAELLIGKFDGAQGLGVFTVASEISTMPTTELVAPINRAAFPGYSQAAGNIEELRRSFLNVNSAIALFALPAGIGILAVADLMVPAILGSNWLEAIPFIQIMAVYGVLQALQSNIGYVYMAVGNAKLVTLTAAIQFIIFLALCFVGVQSHGAIGVAWAYLGVAILMVPVNQFLIARCLKLSGVEFAASLIRPLMASCAMAGLVWLIKHSIGLPQGAIAYMLSLIACIVVGAVAYIFFIYGLWRLATRPSGAELLCFQKFEDCLQKFGIKVNLVRA